MRAKKMEEVNDRDSPTGLISINRPTQNPQQGKYPEEDVDNGEENDSADPQIAEPRMDTNLFYSNGQPKPALGRQSTNAPICIRRICHEKKGRKGSGKGWRRFRGSASRYPGEQVFSHGGRHSLWEFGEADPLSALHDDPSSKNGPNPNRSLQEDPTQKHTTLCPTTTAGDTNDTHPIRGIAETISPSQPDRADTRTHVEQGAIQTGSVVLGPDRDLHTENPPKGINEADPPCTLPSESSLRHGLDTHSTREPEAGAPPSRQDGLDPRDHAGEGGTQTGSACFEPDTALLLQNPLDHDTYDPDQELSRPIRQMKCGD